VGNNPPFLQGLNSSNPDNPIVIEVGKLYFTPLIAKNCGGISLITAF